MKPAHSGLALLVGTLLLLAPGGALPTPAEAETRAPREVWRVAVHSAIQPAVAEYLKRVLGEADQARAEALVIELDTPGGLMSSTEDITTAMLKASTPVVVYVAPRGAHAASAGFFILMAADIAAMAPNTATGAAAAVGPQGEELAETLKKKVSEDSRARIRSLAKDRGRNAELAEQAVAEARSFSAQEALQGRLVELVADDFAALVGQLEGRKVMKAGAPERALAVTGAPVHVAEMTRLERLLAILATPDIAFLLLSFGGLGLMAELYNPGSVLPGVLGAIFLVLAFLGLSVLPVSAAGVALIFLALIFFIAEIKVTSYGLLTVAGVLCLALGGMMLMRSSEPAFEVSRSLIAGVALSALAVAGTLAWLAWKARSRPVSTGQEGLKGRRAEARTALDPRGKVFVHGELWNAEAEQRVEAGETVEILSVEDLVLKVRPVRGAPAVS
ncbi:MAG: nodulation protein NfeD [Thermoanaerobaculia bacterium]